MSGYERLRDDQNNSVNQYPGNSGNAGAPPSYPQIDYNQRSQQQPQQQQPQGPVYGNNGGYQQPLIPQGVPQPSPYAPQATYGQQPVYGNATYTPYQHPIDQQQPVYNAYGAQPVYITGPAVSYAQPVVVAQPGVPGHLIQGTWSDSICDCFTNIPICLLSLFLPCYRWAMTVKRANLMSFWGAFLLYTIPAGAVFGITLYFDILASRGENISGQYQRYDPNYGYYRTTYNNTFVALYVIISLCNLFVLILGTIFRSRIRQKYFIPGSNCEDFFWHCCCPCCATAQEARHVDRDLGLTI